MEQSKDFILESTAHFHAEKTAKQDPDHLPKVPVNLRERLQQASIFANVPLTDSQREAIERSIQREIELVANRYDVDPAIVKCVNDRFERYKRGETSLEELSQFINRWIELDSSLKPESPLTQEIIAAKHYFHTMLKGFIEEKLPLKARTLEDHIFDKNKKAGLEEGAKLGLEKATKLLAPISGYKGAKITCFDLNPDNRTNIEISDGEIPAENPDFENLKWKPYELEPEEGSEEKISLQYATVSTERNLQTTVIFRLSVDDQNLGYIQYHFEGDGIHEIIKRMCAHITGVIDTFIDSKLQQKLEKDIDKKRREILRKNNLTKWREMCTDTCQMLSKILGRPVRFECKRYDVESEEMWAAEVNGKQITTNPQDQDAEGERFPLTLELEAGEETYIGSLVVQCNNEAERRIIEKFKDPLEQILQRREEKRYTFIKAAGLTVANAYLDGNMELLKRMKVGVLYADIVGFSKITKELHEAALREEIEEDTVAKIIDEFVTEVATLLERKYKIAIDKFVGDELIAIYGAPRSNGKDPHGNEKLDVCKCLETLDQVGDDMQESLCKIATDVGQRIRTKYGITGNYPKPEELQFSYSLGFTEDLVGMLGDPESKYSRLDFTVIGDDMNALARVLNAAGAGEKLTTKKSWDEYKKAGGKGLVKVGEPFLIEGKNIGLIEVVLIEKREVREERLAKQRDLISGIEARFIEHKKAGGKNKPLFTEKNLNEFPDGIYQIEFDRKPKIGKYRAKVFYQEGELAEGFVIEIPSIQLEPIEVFVSPEDYRELEKTDKEMLLIKKDEKFTLIKYRSIEDKVAQAIDRLYERNKFLGRNKTEASQKSLIPGEWELVKFWEDGNTLVLQLDRADKKVHLVMPKGDKAMKRMPTKEDNTLVFKDGLIDFKQEFPNWHEDFKVKD